jgi:glycosyltransferase involved in cell wall biosynthesis
MPDRLVISMVVPVRDEEANLRPLHAELTTVLRGLNEPYEIILIDDGSVDRTFEHACDLHRQDPAVRVIRFTRNFGQTAAFAAGFAAARGEFIVTCDGDLQNDPADIPKMLQLAATHDIVVGWRKRRRDAFLTRHVPSVMANLLLGWVSGVRLHDNGCSLKVFRASVVKPLHLQPGMHRYLPALAKQFGNRIVEVEVHHRPRQFGQSKYGLSRTFRVLADLVRLRRLMRDAAIVPPGAPPLYEVAERREVNTKQAVPAARDA